MKGNQTLHSCRASRAITAAFAALFLMHLLTVLARAEKMIWQGGTDSNWNIARNWSSPRVPGSREFDDAVIKGKDAIVSVPTPVAAANDYSVEVASGGFSVYRERHASRRTAQCARWSIEGHPVLSQRSPSRVTCRSQEGSAADPGEYHLQSGVLSVGGLLRVHGRFTVDDAHSEIAVKEALLSEGSVLKFDFDLDGVSPITVNDQLTIEDGARIEIDLRGNNVGSNVVRLLEFSSLSGDFGPRMSLSKGIATES